MKQKLILGFFLSVIIFPIFGQDYIKVIKPVVNIRFNPSTSANIVAQAENDNVFELKNEKNGWYEITMFSGEYRYIHKSVCEKTNYNLVLTDNVQLKKTVFKALGNIEDKAQSDADKKYPTDFSRNIDYFRLLCDKYKLEIMNKYKFQPPTYSKLILEGVKKNW